MEEIVRRTIILFFKNLRSVDFIVCGLATFCLFGFMMNFGKHAITTVGIMRDNTITIPPIHQAPIHLGSVCSIGGGLYGLTKYFRQTEANESPNDGPKNLPNDDMLMNMGAKALGELSSTKVGPKVQ